MFGPVDESRDHSVITVKHPVKIMPLRRAPLGPGVYKIQGDIRNKLGHSTVQRHLSAGVFSVKFVPGEAEQKVSARTLFDSPAPTEVANPSEADAQSAPSKDLPGLADVASNEIVVQDNSALLPQDNNLTIVEPETIVNEAVDGEPTASVDLGDLSAPEAEPEAPATEPEPATGDDFLGGADDMDDLPEPPAAEASAPAAKEEVVVAPKKRRRRKKAEDIDL